MTVSALMSGAFFFFVHLNLSSQTIGDISFGVEWKGHIFSFKIWLQLRSISKNAKEEREFHILIHLLILKKENVPRLCSAFNINPTFALRGNTEGEGGCGE